MLDRIESEHIRHFITGFILCLGALKLAQFGYQIVVFQNILMELIVSALGSLVIMYSEGDFN
jgi:hypothetical protein